MKSAAWLLLLYGLPAKQTAERVSLWRKLKKFGALQLKTSAYVLPDEASHYERFQWLAQRVRDGGGEATLMRVSEIEGLANEQIVQLFNDARARDYAVLVKALNHLVQRNKKRPVASFSADLEKLGGRFKEIREVDYFGCPQAHDAEMLLSRTAGRLKPAGKRGAPLSRETFAGKTWLTRPRPEIDRVGSAWLIRKFIDPRASFVFAVKPSQHPGAIPYDMSGVEFTHHGDDCTFETLLNRFGVEDKTAREIGEMIHDADLEDGKFQRHECFGLDRVFKGWARIGLSDAEILSKGFECFDALYAALKHR